ncbi:M23 family metallopeptidase [Parvularcula flava]|nr:M23 family metallopeptidase [Aquisalinus luteolus]
MKAALKATGYQGEPGKIESSLNDTKIASLQIDEFKSSVSRADAAQIVGDLVQGGLGIGQTLPGATVTLDGRDVAVDGEGRFIIGFDRDHPKAAEVVILLPDGSAPIQRVLAIAPRDFPTQSLTLDQSKVSGFTEAQLEEIRVSTAKKDAARAKPSPRTAYWANGFVWPVTGPISGVFGSQRILNGEPKRPHSGVDVAAPTGSDIVAPADGIVTLAETGMYFEGGLVFIDHGQGLESALMHMSRVDVEAGDEVKKGDVIGAVGATGRATGPHLHWSLKWQDRLVDAQLVVGEMPDS